MLGFIFYKEGGESDSLEWKPRSPGMLGQQIGQGGELWQLWGQLYPPRQQQKFRGSLHRNRGIACSFSLPVQAVFTCWKSLAAFPDSVLAPGQGLCPANREVRGVNHPLHPFLTPVWAFLFVWSFSHHCTQKRPIKHSLGPSCFSGLIYWSLWIKGFCWDVAWVQQREVGDGSGRSSPPDADGSNFFHWNTCRRPPAPFLHHWTASRFR